VNVKGFWSDQYVEPLPDDEESLKELSTSLLRIEELAADGSTPEDLMSLIQYVHRGFAITMPIYETGMEIFRAVKVHEKPTNKQRLSYPPIERVQSQGRLNGISEVVFYGSFDSYFSCLYECGAKVGDLFAIGRWRVVKPILLNHLGYTNATLGPWSADNRIHQPWTNVAPGKRNAMLREWQTKVFTARAKTGDEACYTVTIVLAHWATQNAYIYTPGKPTEIGGVQYPAVSVNFSGDNVALKPSVVETSLELIESIYGKVKGLTDAELIAPDYGGSVFLLNLDRSCQNRRDGRLIWCHDPTPKTVTPWP